MSVKTETADHIPDAADWAVAIYPNGGGSGCYWMGIDDVEAARLLRHVASQIEQQIVPDPDSSTQH